MEAKDASSGVDFEAVYTKLKTLESLSYKFEDRNGNVHFKEIGDETQVVIEFDPETQHPIEMQ